MSPRRLTVTKAVYELHTLTSAQAGDAIPAAAGELQRVLDDRDSKLGDLAAARFILASLRVVQEGDNLYHAVDFKLAINPNLAKHHVNVHWPKP